MNKWELGLMIIALFSIGFLIYPYITVSPYVPPNNDQGSDETWCYDLEGFERDQCYYSYAVQGLRYTKCPNIDKDTEVNEKNYRNLCYTEVARLASRGYICDEIEDLDDRDNCFYIVAVDIPLEELCEKIKVESLEEECYAHFKP